MRRNLKILVVLFFISTFLISMNASAININNSNDSYKIINNAEIDTPIYNSNHDYSKDVEPFGDLEITVTIKEIRAYDKIDLLSDPDFYVRLTINGERFKSKIWHNQKFVNEEWSTTVDIPEDMENVSITIQLWDWNPGIDKLCDISGTNDGIIRNVKYVNLEYSTLNGHWRGSDFIFPDSPTSDRSGYGRLNGLDDNSYKIQEGDCELLFDITQTDPDGDGIPAWTEEKVYGTDPQVDNTGWDNDTDGVPIEWEFKWGHGYYNWGHYWHEFWFYNPFEYEDHSSFDVDKDGLDNVEEYLTSQWGSNPYRQDIFLEIDQMEIDNGRGAHVPQSAKDMLRDAFGRRNICLFIDDHEEDVMTGGELIPFKNMLTTWDAARNLRWRYFLHMDENNWRRGVFHYAVIVCEHEKAEGFAFDGDSFLLDATYCKENSGFGLKNLYNTKTLNREERAGKVWASLMMHETGHILGIHHGNTKGCDNRETYNPWQVGFWKWSNYKSCMNYRYALELVDYSDGTHGKNDFDDWERIDLTRFSD
jgi:hypothetical protein